MSGLPKKLIEQRVPWQQVFDLCEDGMIPPGAMASHRTRRRVSIIRLAQFAQLRDWFNDKRHGAERGGPMSAAAAWYWAGFTHTSCVLGRAGIAEMIRPQSQVRTWDMLAGETVMISLPLMPPAHRALAAHEMALAASRGLDYPETKLLANWHRLNKWGRKWLGNEKFDQIFDRLHDREVCSGTYVEALLAACPERWRAGGTGVETLRAYPLTALTPAFLAVLGEPVFHRQMLLQLH